MSDRDDFGCAFENVLYIKKAKQERHHILNNDPSIILIKRQNFQKTFIVNNVFYYTSQIYTFHICF